MLTGARTLSLVLAALAVGGAATACSGGPTEPPLSAPSPVASSVAPREGAPASVASAAAVGVVQAPPTWPTTFPGAVPTTAFRDADVCSRLRATRSWASAPGHAALAGSGDSCVWETAPPGNLRVVLTRIDDVRTTIEQYQRTHDVVDVLDGAGRAGLLTVDDDRWTVALVLDGLLLEVGPAPRPVAEDAARRLSDELERSM